MVHFEDDTIYVVDITPPWWPAMGLGALNAGAVVLMAVQRLERLRAPDGKVALPGLVCGFEFDMKHVMLRYRKPVEFSEEHFKKQIEYLADMLTSMGPRSEHG